MKKLFLGLVLSVFSLAVSNAQTDDYSEYSDYGDYTGYDGDFFSLEGAIDLFKNSNSIEDFERRLNREDTWVNNLDLNSDGRIDYIRVNHRRSGKYHAIILQVPINRYDVQDIAVIEIEKTGRRRAMLQIVGDADLYGEEVYVEPFEGNGYSNGRGGPNADYHFNRGYVNVYYWPAIRHMFGRRYRVYSSPYRWQYYPTWWTPWRPCGWNVFRPRIVIYQRHYHVVYVHRLVRVRNFYRPYRASCPTVIQRTTNIRNTGVRSSYSRASQERIRSGKKLGKSNANVSRGKVKSNQVSKSKTRVERGGKKSTRLQRSNKSTRQKAPKLDRSERGTSSNTQRYEPRTKTKTKKSSKFNRSTKETRQKSSKTSRSKRGTSSNTQRYEPRAKTKTKKSSRSSRSTKTAQKKSRSSSKTKRQSSRKPSTSKKKSSRSKSKSRTSKSRRGN